MKILKKFQYRQKTNVFPSACIHLTTNIGTIFIKDHHIKKIFRFLPTNIYMATLLQHVPRLFHVLLQQVLYVHLVLPIPGESQVEVGQSAVFGVFIQFVFIQVIFAPVSTAKVQHSVPNWLTW